VRTLSVSRATVRKVVRGPLTEFKYERGVQPSPQASAIGFEAPDGDFWRRKAKLPKRGNAVRPQRLFEELRGRRI